MGNWINISGIFYKIQNIRFLVLQQYLFLFISLCTREIYLMFCLFLFGDVAGVALVV